MDNNTRSLLCGIDSAITMAKAAFGAPGDYGYSTLEGKALYTLYLLRLDIVDLLMREDVEGRDNNAVNLTIARLLDFMSALLIETKIGPDTVTAKIKETGEIITLQDVMINARAMINADLKAEAIQ